MWGVQRVTVSERRSTSLSLVPGPIEGCKARRGGVTRCADAINPSLEQGCAITMAIDIFDTLSDCGGANVKCLVGCIALKRQIIGL